MYRAMKFAATPISSTDRNRPKTNTHGWSRAAPATASTLSRLMLTSASATPQAARANVFAGFRPECSSPATSFEPALSPLWRISRNIFHATHSSRIPPARTRPTTWSSSLTRRAKAIRNTKAASTPMKMTFLRCSAGSPAASAPTTIALSPARTMSMNRIWKNAAIAEALIRLASIPRCLAESQHLPQPQHMFAADPAFVDHAAGDPQDYDQADIIDPAVSFDQPSDIIGGETHEKH